MSEHELEQVRYERTMMGDIAHLFCFPDGVRWVVKFKNNPHGTRELVNEYVVTRLAQLVGLPAVPFQVVSLGAEAIRQIPRKYAKRYQAGHQFASLFVDNCLTVKDNGLLPPLESIVNPEALPAMIVFDHWVHNTDRKTHNLLLETVPDGYRLHLIDHGRCFSKGYDWTPSSLKRRPQKPMQTSVIKWAAPLLQGEGLAEWAAVIASLPDEQIREVIQSVPDDWDLTEREQEVLYRFLADQKLTLADRMERLASRFD